MAIIMIMVMIMITHEYPVILSVYVSFNNEHISHINKKNIKQAKTILVVHIFCLVMCNVW